MYWSMLMFFGVLAPEDWNISEKHTDYIITPEDRHVYTCDSDED